MHIPSLFFVSLTIWRGFSCPGTAPGGVSPGLPGQHWGLAVAAVSRPRAGDFGAHRSTFLKGILALPGGRPLGAHCHGNRVGMAAPIRRWRGLAPAVGFPTAPGLWESNGLEGKKGKGVDDQRLQGPARTPWEVEGLQRWRVPQRHPTCPQVPT